MNVVRNHLSLKIQNKLKSLSEILFSPSLVLIPMVKSLMDYKEFTIVLIILLAFLERQVDLKKKIYIILV